MRVKCCQPCKRRKKVRTHGVCYAHFGVGAAQSMFTGRGLFRSGFDMFVVGLGVGLDYLANAGMPILDSGRKLSVGDAD